MKDFKAVIFDMDGVIFDSEAVWKDIFEIANKHFNVCVTEKFRQSTCGRKDEKNIQELQKQFPDVNAKEYWQFIKKTELEIYNQKGAPLKKGFKNLIQYLKLNNFKIALATGTHKNIVNILFEKAGLSINDIFDVIVTSEDISVGKPNPEIFLKAVSKLNVEAKDCIVLEDSINGIKASKKAGCKPIMVIDLIQPNSWAKENCYKIFNNLKQVQNFINE